MTYMFDKIMITIGLIIFAVLLSIYVGGWYIEDQELLTIEIGLD